MNSFPPNTFFVAKDITISRDNIGMHHDGWPVTWSANAYDCTASLTTGGYPASNLSLANYTDVTANCGWARSFRPSMSNLFTPGNTTPSNNTLDGLLLMLDKFLDVNQKLLWQVAIFGVSNNNLFGNASDLVLGFSGSFTTSGGNATGPVDTTNVSIGETVYFGFASSAVNGFSGYFTLTNNNPITFPYSGTLSSVTGYYINRLAEVRFRDCMENLFNSPRTSPKGYTLANHPALGGIEMVNEATTTPVSFYTGPYIRILAQTLTRFRSPTLPAVKVLGCNMQGYYDVTVYTGPRGWAYAHAGTSKSSNPVYVNGSSDYGNNKRVVDWTTAWSHHMYGFLNKTTEVNAKNDAIASSQLTGGNLTGFTKLLSIPYWYSPSAGITNPDPRGYNLSPYFPPLWNTESDLSPDEVQKIME
jgi:hypothetical protein